MDFQLRHIERSSNRESKLTNKNMAEEEAPCYDFIDPVGYDWDCTPSRKGPPISNDNFDPKILRYDSDEDEEAILHYINQLELSDGFHADKPKKRFYWTSFVVDKVTSQDCIDAAYAAVEEFNNLKGADLKFLKLLSVTSRITGGIFYFLTLQCTDERFYEAKIFITLEGARDLFMFRPAKHYPRPSTN
ncbi:uncharacterized protein LOC115717277 isoform X2 [Cannabis sativa]|nr:uncharacterized protein LOC115717277 isoform X2 [Cannabis sativa]